MRIVLLSLFLIAPLCLAGPWPASAQTAAQPDPRTVPRFGELDNSEAKVLIRAALNGNPVAQTAIGTIYAAGLGVAINMCVANLWYDKAARGGDAEAQHALGHAYVLGAGVKRDPVLAYLWVSAAKRGGHPPSEQYLESISSHMSEEDLAKARARESTFDPATMPPADIYVLTSELNDELRAIATTRSKDAPSCGFSVQELIDSLKRRKER